MTDTLIPILIPSYDPDVSLSNTIRDLREIGLTRIVIVDDGSALTSQEIFNSLELIDEVDVIHRTLNQGKGAAIKTGLRFISEKYPDSIGVITVDGDGQHLAGDVFRVLSDAHLNPESFVLGVRAFSREVPWRSRIGNNLTRFISKTIFHLDITDTQTGLRFLPRVIWNSLLSIKGERYEFEMDCLFLAKRLGLSFREVAIETVYIDQNKASHFRPILDSARIYAVFARFSLSGIVSFLVDVGCFLALLGLIKDVFFSAIIARCVSGIVNFSLNKIVVFKRYNQSKILREITCYLGLWTVINLTSASLLTLADHLFLSGILIAKILIDGSLFVVSFLVQNVFIFRKK